MESGGQHEHKPSAVLIVSLCLWVMGLVISALQTVMEASEDIPEVQPIYSSILFFKKRISGLER